MKLLKQTLRLTLIISLAMGCADTNDTNADTSVSLDTGNAAGTGVSTDTGSAADPGTTDDLGVDIGTSADTSNGAGNSMDTGTSVDVGTPQDTAAETEVPPNDDPADSNKLDIGFCYNDHDNAVNKDPVVDIAASCGLCCLGRPDQGACATDCMVNGGESANCFTAIEPAGLTAQCSSCFVNTILCAIDNCVPQCLAPTSDACVACRIEYCDPEFYECSGIEEPCDDGGDSNGDGKVDCADPSCAFSKACL